MDAAGMYGALGAAFTVGTAIVVIAVYATSTRKLAETTEKEHEATAHKVRNLDNWRLSILPTELNANFVRKETMASELKSIHDSLTRIEKHQEMMAQRFMNGGAGMGA